MRATRNEAWSYFELALTNAQDAVKGEFAYINTATGLLSVGATATTLKAVGYFDETVTGDGSTKVRVRLFKEIRVHWFDNDTGTAVVAADIGTTAYAVDATSVTSDSTGKSAVGIIWGVNTLNGVAVQVNGF